MVQLMCQPAPAMEFEPCDNFGGPRRRAPVRMALPTPDLMEKLGHTFLEVNVKQPEAAAPSLKSALDPAARALLEGPLQFGPFTFSALEGRLYRDGEPVPLGSRARLILEVLTSNQGRLVKKSEIMAKVWPDTTVVDNNLTVHIAALRHALDDGQGATAYILNVPGQGYRFVAPICVLMGENRHASGSQEGPARSNLPAMLRPAVDLEKSIGSVREKLRKSNLVTITGPAGVGKTTLALHVAQMEASSILGWVRFVDLAAIAEGSGISLAIAKALQVELNADDANQGLLSVLNPDTALLVLDNCEHLIEPVADFAAAVLRQCPHVRLLTTSRELLKVSEEATFALPPLRAPDDSTPFLEALQFPAVQLFVTSMRAAGHVPDFSPEDAVAIGRICRRLDGLPLALELASALIGPFSLHDLAGRLDDLFKLMQCDRRGAPQRHRSLTAALEWSYSLLTGEEQKALRCVAVYPDGFTLEEAAASAGIHDLGEVGALLAKLCSKSLVARDICSKALRFKLLMTTRAFALSKGGDDETPMRRLGPERAMPPTGQ